MVNRINLILKAKNITSKQFAEEIGVQPSGMSHILSGRNNPSLDFVMKVVRRYPEIDINWLMFGKGEMYVPSYATPLQTPVQVAPPVRRDSPVGNTERKQDVDMDLFSSVNEAPAGNQAPQTPAMGGMLQGQVQQPAQPASSIRQEDVPQQVVEKREVPQVAPQPTPVAEQLPVDENRKNESVCMVDGKEPILAKQKKIVKFVVLYDDHTFSEFYPER